MKQILRLFSVVGIVLLTAMMTAGSCDITLPPIGGTNTNTNSGGGNSGGGNNGGGGTDSGIKPLKFSSVDAALVKINNNTDILLKASAFPANFAGMGGCCQNFNAINTTAANTRKKAFDIEYDGATGGMLFVANGDVASAAAVTTPANVGTALNQSTGIHVTTVAAAAGTLGAGVNIVSVFAEYVPVPTAGQIPPGVAPFAFSPTQAAGATQPVFWCVGTITTITDLSAGDVNTKALTGGQKSSCYVASTGVAALGTPATATAWFTAADPFKREFQFAVAGIKTDAKTIVNIGLPGADDAAKIANFTDGINATEMAAIIAANPPVPFTKFKIKIVKDADFK